MTIPKTPNCISTSQLVSHYNRDGHWLLFREQKCPVHAGCSLIPRLFLFLERQPLVSPTHEILSIFSVRLTYRLSTKHLWWSLPKATLLWISTDFILLTWHAPHTALFGVTCIAHSPKHLIHIPGKKGLSMKITVASPRPIHRFAVCGVSYRLSTVVWKYQIENSNPGQRGHCPMYQRVAGNACIWYKILKVQKCRVKTKSFSQSVPSPKMSF